MNNTNKLGILLSKELKASGVDITDKAMITMLERMTEGRDLKHYLDHDFVTLEAWQSERLQNIGK